MRRLWVGVVSAAMCVAPVRGVAQSDLAAKLNAMAAEPAVARAHWGVMVTDMDGTPIYALNEGQFFQPASNAKLFTTAAAVHLLGTYRQFTTVLEGPAGYRGSMSPQGDTVNGDLILRGSGDANLSGRAVPYVPPSQGEQAKADPLRYLARLADAVKAGNVRRITGDIVGDDTLFPLEPYAEDWAADDLLWGYGAPVSALSVNDNQIEVTIRPAARAGDPAAVTLDPAIPFYTVEASVRTVARKEQAAVEIDREPGSRMLRIGGTIAASAGADVEEVAITDPAEYAAAALKSLLEARGIQVDGRARAEHRRVEEPGSFQHTVREPLPDLPRTAVPSTGSSQSMHGCFDACPLHVEHVSPTVSADITIANKVSQNLHAELLLRQLGRQYGSDGSFAQGARVVRQFLLNAGLNGDDFVFYDGSGLSGHDLVTPRVVTKLLQYASTQPWFADWKKSLPVGGVDGSLEHRFTESSLKGRVFAKTGTLGEARALSGYIECASGRTVIFTILVDQHAPGTSADREVMDRMVAAIAAAN